MSTVFLAVRMWNLATEYFRINLGSLRTAYNSVSDFAHRSGRERSRGSNIGSLSSPKGLLWASFPYLSPQNFSSLLTKGSVMRLWACCHEAIYYISVYPNSSSICPSIYDLANHVPIYTSIHTTHPSIHTFIHTYSSFCPYTHPLLPITHPSIYLCTHPFSFHTSSVYWLIIYLSILTPISTSIHLPVHLSICLSVHVSSQPTTQSTSVT